MLLVLVFAVCFVFLALLVFDFGDLFVVISSTWCFVLVVAGVFVLSVVVFVFVLVSMLVFAAGFTCCLISVSTFIGLISLWRWFD